MATEQEQENNTDWLRDELQEVSLGDKRLDRRVLDIGEKLSSRPTGSINQACDDWSDTKASYRLFANEKTTAEKIMAPHQKRTAERASGHKRVFAIQDTSYLDYSSHLKKKGMGPIGTTEQNISGMVMHSTLFASEGGVPLGIATQDIWVRPQEAKQLSRAERQKMPIDEKESFKWLKALEETARVAPADTQVVTICDTESDIFEFLDCARLLQTDLLIRAIQDRNLADPEVGHLRKSIKSKECAGQIIVDVPSRNGQPKRKATVSVRYAEVTLKTPQHLKKEKIADIPIYVVLAEEENPPADIEDPLNWLLLTTVPVFSFGDAIERIEWYRIRWRIETYHKVLKSGCQVEKSKLSSADRLLPFIALCSIIAWRLFWLTHIARQEPDAPCTVVLAEHEWQSLFSYHHKSSQLPVQPPTLAQAVLWIAQLGGFLARKHDGNPGVTVIWRGWQRLSDISDAWLIFQQAAHPDSAVADLS